MGVTDFRVCNYLFFDAFNFVSNVPATRRCLAPCTTVELELAAFSAWTPSFRLCWLNMPGSFGT